MNEKIDRRIKKTKAQLRLGLARLMQKKSIKEITVRELVDEVDINRSTFYLHYTDIYNMLKSIEDELSREILRVFDAHPAVGLNENSFPFIADIFQILEENRDICRALLGPNGDIAFVNQIEQLIADSSLKPFQTDNSVSYVDFQYACSFFLSGCIGLIKTWLDSEHPQSPEHMAKLTYQMMVNCMGDLW